MNEVSVAQRRGLLLYCRITGIDRALTTLICMDRAAFEKHVIEGYDKLPQWVRDNVSNVALLIEERPSKEVRAREGLASDETLLGYYQGVPLTERGDMYGVAAVLPDTITLYRIPILEAARQTGVSVSDVICDTIWHEYAHHFGIDEEGVREREAQRGIGDYRAPMV